MENLLVLIIFLVLALIVLMAVYGMYVSVMKARNKTQEAFSSIDVQLKKRYDLIPNILKIAKKFMEHERGLMEEIVSLRSKAMGVSNDLSESEKKFALDKQINAKLGQIMVAVENYPELKSDQTMVQAMNAFQDAEEHIAAARRFYNSAVLELNNKTDIFPTSIIAAMCGVRRQQFFETDEVSRQSIDASNYLN
ncbi:MAG: LemA family protein [Cyanobacteria bacterium SIG27]|nr:LemA family protein [Cyanobacteria bacterium SIG27]